MSSTLEAINIKFLKKFALAGDLLAYCPSEIEARLADQLQNLIADYEVRTAEPISQYYIDKEVNIYIGYLRLVMNLAIIQRLEAIFIELKHVLPADNPELQKQLSQLEELVIELPNLANNRYYCDACHVPLTIDTEQSTFFCRKCGRAEKIQGMNFELVERETSSTNGYDPTGRFKFLVDRCQAKEFLTIPDSVLESLRQCARKYSIHRTDITCDDVRLFLQQIHQSKYNDHVPHIRKLLTGISPPELTPEEIKEIQPRFYAAVRIYEVIKPPTRKNCPCHRYFLYKSIEDVLANHPDTARTEAILACIHLQSENTVIKNDLFWKKICSRYRAITYRPTSIKYTRRS